GSQDASNTPIMIADANADGVQEVFYKYGYFASPQYFLFFDALEWDGHSFRSLIPKGVGTSSFDGPSLKDVDGNGTLEIFLTQEVMTRISQCDAGPTRNPIDILTWDGEYYRYMWTDPGIPEYRFQTAFDGDYYVTVGLLDRAESMYLQALSDPKLEAFIWKEWAKYFGIFCGIDWQISEPNEPQYIRAYTRLRLLELYVYQEKIDEAKTIWQSINGHKATITEKSYASLAQTFWVTFQSGNSIEAACNIIEGKAAEMKEELFSWMVYGYQNPGPTAETICPFHSGSG
ncbi:MAG: hypothetical protein WBM17_10220, partial [Anaerolineales bacterium]